MRRTTTGARRSWIAGWLLVGQGVACWVAASPSGRLAYTGNAAGSISGFAIGGDRVAAGAARRRRDRGARASPRDLDFDASGRFLHAVRPRSAATGGQVTTYAVGRDGSLTRVGSAQAAAGITGAAAS